MTAYLRTPDENFIDLPDFPFEPHYHEWNDLQMHYLDEGPADGPVMLLLHGMPTWAFLYRHIIPVLVDAGYRCIAPDHMGFGRSDKPTDSNWYTIARHTEILTSLINALNLKDITLVCQDWGGPTGLAQATFAPDRFSRLVIMNTWLHHPEYEYSEAIRHWNQNWHEGGNFHTQKPDMGYLLVLSAGYIPPSEAILAIIGDKTLTLEGEALNIYTGFHAPIKDMPDDAYNGFRRFPLSLCFDDHEAGNGTVQTLCYKTLQSWEKPAHFIWGCADDIFTEVWGRQWAAEMNASFNPIENAGHFLQNTHGEAVANIILKRIEAE